MNNYDDIINLSYNGSTRSNKMTLQNRSAQFAPFSALDGYEEKIIETARKTDNKIELDDSRKEIINQKIKKIKEELKKPIKVKITYYSKYKDGNNGVYKTISCNIKKINEFEGIIILENNLKLKMADVLDITLI